MESTSLRQVRGWELDRVKDEVGEVKTEQKKHNERLDEHDKHFASAMTTARIAVGLAVLLIPLLTTLFAWLILEVSHASVSIQQMEKGEKKK